MADQIVIDTSSILATVKEDESGQREVDACEGKALLAPESVRWEIVNALRQSVYKGFIKPEMAQRTLQAALVLPIHYVGIDQVAALQIALSFPRLLAYDAFVLQCALERGYPLLTSERVKTGSMADYARQLGIQLVGERIMTARDEALRLADTQGRSTLREGDRLYDITACKQVVFEAAKFKRVSMPGVSLEQLIDIVREMRGHV